MQATPWQPNELAANLGVLSLENIFNAFVKAGILLRSAEPEGVALARPPESVTVREILDVVGESAAPVVANDGPAAQVLRRRDQAVEKALEGVTLRSLVTETPSTILRFPQIGSAAQSR